MYCVPLELTPCMCHCKFAIVSPPSVPGHSERAQEDPGSLSIQQFNQRKFTSTYSGNTLNCKLYLFYNITWLQIGHKVIFVGLRINTKHFQLGKTIEISFLDKKKTILLMLAVGYEPTASQSLSGGAKPRLIHHLYH